MSLASLIAYLFNFTPTQQQQHLVPSDGRDPQTSLAFLQYGEGQNTSSNNSRPTETQIQTMEEEEDEIRPPYLRVHALF